MAVENANKKRKIKEEAPADALLYDDEVVAEETENKVKGKNAEAKGKGKGTGTGIGNGPRSPWSDDRDQLLTELVTKMNKEGSDWKSVHKTFDEKYPEDGKTLFSLKGRWKRIKGGAADELSDKEKELFKQSVEEIQSKRFPEIELITMRYNVLAKANLTRTASQKLMKAMKNWNLNGEKAGGSEDGGQGSPEDEKDGNNAYLKDEDSD